MVETSEDLKLSNMVITRINKEALLQWVNISKEARSAISPAASLFVLYAMSCANNFAMKGKEKTPNAGNVVIHRRDGISVIHFSFERSTRCI
uniref:Uncharacterized protein n=1 Tax=Monodelphis domestica TaxID=13616 RepID=A0A5F8GIM7_MONDO